MLTKLKKLFCNYLWVLNAYLRGKVLRQRAYRPRGNLFHATPGATCRRQMLLIKWWGFQPATLEEAMELMSQEEKSHSSDYVPFLSWTNDRWTNDRLDLGDWDNNYRFLILK